MEYHSQGTQNAEISNQNHKSQITNSKQVLNTEIKNPKRLEFSAFKKFIKLLT